ncbi:phosphoribosyltransferase [Allostreptomyces psammosilenae]|uniref:Putative phosphoribosyltransferase n=1 Tax=Allostreptomyces psammosilenae TaxID=1892865 RepID=A0A852ZRZ9_9ACTN|nr:phosphoribosyltransferase family protein [Allostreptomyces psammosilenae]NYI03634.1 putative phosphoribosyltransferase [Allostreptomyces psammosilenae]
MRFSDRREAGRALAARLRETTPPLTDPLVLALPRGGVPVAYDVARELNAPLDVLVVRKLGAPFQPELGVGAVTGEDPPVFNDYVLEQVGLTEQEMAPVVVAERAEVRRREERYRGGRPAPEVAGRTVVVVDDGLATGITALVGCRSVRSRGPERLLLAVPVGAADAVAMLSREVDEVVCLSTPLAFQAVGAWYDDFAQLTDENVLDLLAARRRELAQGQEAANPGDAP